ncbi:MAG: tetratricopeptide repeat protein [Polyangiales bacterium]
MMRALIILVALTRIAASDDDAVRKGTPDKFVKAAGEAFRAAVAADKSGDLNAALGLYQKAFAISPHPSTAYNIADVQRRLNQLPAALKSYAIYLAIAPTAADKVQVEALIDKLDKTPGMLWVSTAPPSDPEAIDLDDAYILIDGEIKKQPGVEIHAGPFGFREGFGVDIRSGEHVVDVVTAVSFGSAICKFGPGENRECSVRAPPRTDGSVVFNSNERSIEVRVPAKSNRRNAAREVRFVLPAGKQRLELRDRNYECATIPIEVPKGGDVAYTFVSTTEHDRLERCRSVKLVQHKLHFAP